jgi:hypothetical protein
MCRRMYSGKQPINKIVFLIFKNWGPFVSTSLGYFKAYSMYEFSSITYRIVYTSFDKERLTTTITAIDFTEAFQRVWDRLPVYQLHEIAEVKAVLQKI